MNSLLTRQCNECETPIEPMYPPSFDRTDVALLAWRSSSSDKRIKVPSSISCQAWSSSGRGSPENRDDSGSFMSHLLT